MTARRTPVRERLTHSRFMRNVLVLAVGAFVALFVLAYRRVLGVTQRPSWPPPCRRGHAGGRAGCNGGVRGTRRGRPARRSASVRLVDRGDDRAMGRGRELLPEDLRRRRGRAVDGAHPDVRLARGRDRDEDGSAPGAEAGGGRRGQGDRGRVRLQAVRAGAGDVHEPRRRRSADRRQRRLPTRPGRPLPRRPARRLAAGRGRPGRSPQAVRDRRRGRVDGWRGHRGSLRERRLP